ncbi:MAG TPA: hypothetical protein VGR91_16410 [Stellaceae bacterium]|nr:hypothetical protein [Stellaceae bacterium]
MRRRRPNSTAPLSNGGNAKSVYFPFCADATELRARIKECRLHAAGADVVKAIETLKPYRGGNALLRAIHDMDIADKHQALLPVLGAATISIKAVIRHPNIGLPAFSTRIVKDGQILVGTPPFPGIDIGAEIPVEFFLAFGGAPGFGGRVVLEFLKSLAQETNGIFKALTALRPGAVIPVVPAKGHRALMIGHTTNRS